jgi:hypothetical protein
MMSANVISRIAQDRAAKAQLYRRPGAQFIFDGSVEEVLDRFNEVDPFGRSNYFIRSGDRIYHAEDIDELQSE